MKHGKMASRTKVLAGAVLLCFGLTAAISASATDTYGGGATLPAGAYVGFDFLNGLGAAKLSSNTATAGTNGASAVNVNSFFGKWSAASGHKVSYCQTGSGGGKKIFDLTDGASPAHALTSAQPCDGSVSPTEGFGAPTGVAVDPYFAASDAPMSQLEYDNFAAGGKVAKYTRPAQYPVIAGTIAIIYRNSDVTGTLNLTDAQICGVLQGAITDWFSLGVGTAPGKKINVVFRSDGSGTTFSLSNHLTAQTPSPVCPAVGTKHFVADQTFTNVAAAFAPLPANWVGANGNPAVVSAVAATEGTFGYAESANVAAVSSSLPNLKFATVNGLDPFANFPASITVGTIANQVVGVNANGSASNVSLTTVPPSPACLNIVAPSTYANASGRYPIMAVSYLITNVSGNGTDAPAVQSLINFMYSHTGVTLPAGFAFIHPLVAPNTTTCIGA